MRRRKANRAGYYIREGVSSIFNHGFMSFASVCIIIACLLIMGSFTLLALNVDGIIKTMESQNVILVYMNETLSEEEARAAGSLLEAVENVESAVFISRDQAMTDFIGTFDDENATILEGLDSSFLRHRFQVFIKDIALMEKTQNALREVPGVGTVSAHLEISRGFVRIRDIVTIVSLALVLILFVISLFIMSNTVKLTTFERKDEIAIMKMVGATSSFIRWPFVIEGLLLGLIGSLAAYLMQWGLYRLLLSGPLANSGISFLTVIPFSVVAVPLLVAFMAVGLGVGVIGSLMAIKNYLKV